MSDLARDECSVQDKQLIRVNLCSNYYTVLLKAIPFLICIKAAQIKIEGKNSEF